MKETKKVTANISYECWKELRKLAIDKDLNLQDAVADVLEKSMQKKSKKVFAAEPADAEEV